MTSKVIDETNQHRKSHGLGEVTLDNDLQSKAQAYADEMKSYNTSNFSDQPINYHHQQGIDHYENIMWAHNMQPGSIDPFESWKNSAAHNRAMLADVHRIGVGVAFDQNTKHFFAVMKLNSDLGDPRCGSFFTSLSYPHLGSIVTGFCDSHRLIRKYATQE